MRGCGGRGRGSEGVRAGGPKREEMRRERMEIDRGVISAKNILELGPSGRMNIYHIAHHFLLFPFLNNDGVAL